MNRIWHKVNFFKREGPLTHGCLIEANAKNNWLAGILSPPMDAPQASGNELILVLLEEGVDSSGEGRSESKIFNG